MREQQGYVIAYDLGTGGVKAALVDLNGRFMEAATHEYPLLTPQTGWAEQDPQAYWQGVIRATQTALEKSGCRPENAKGMAFGTQWKGIIPVDSFGRVLHNSIIWLDRRAEEEAQSLNAYFGKSLFCGADYWPKLMWFRRHRSKLYERTEMFLEANSFLKWKATGVAAVDVSNHFIRSFDPKMAAFYRRILDAAGINIGRFPPLVAATAMVGRVSEIAAQEMGLVPGIPVFGGCGDIPAIAIGSGATEPGAMHAYFGSSGWLGLIRPHSSEELYVSPFDERSDIALFATQSIGLSLNWTLRQLYGREWEEKGDEIFSYINKELLLIPPGSDGVLATPWLFGERPPHFSAAARGSFLNLSSVHDRRHMLKALMEGVCYTLRMNLPDAFKDAAACPACINAVGGGALSDVWMQALADILEVPVHVPDSPRHAGALGTAYCALIGLGCFKDFREAAAQVRIKRRFEPRAKAVQIYRQAYPVFSGLYRRLEPVLLDPALPQE